MKMLRMPIAATCPAIFPKTSSKRAGSVLWQRRLRFPAARAAAQVGRTQDVIIDGPGEREGEMIGRTKADAPEVDGVVYLSNASHLQPGDIIRADITDADAYDLYGSPA